MFKSAAPPTNLQELTASIQQAVRISGGYKKFQRMYANDRVAFAYDCFGKVGKTLTFYQEEILSYFDEGFTRVAVRGPHGLGKTYLASILVHHGVLTAEDDAKVITTASAWRQVEKYLWPEIKKLSKSISWDMIGREPYDPNHEFLQMSIKLNQGTVEAFAVVSDDYQTIEGAHAKKLVYIFDEAKSIPRNTWNAAEGAFSNATSGKPTQELAIIDRGELGLIEENVPYFNQDKPIADVWDMIMAGVDPDVGTDQEYNQGIKFDSIVPVYQAGGSKKIKLPIVVKPMAQTTSKTMLDNKVAGSLKKESPETIEFEGEHRDAILDRWGEEIKRIEQDDSQREEDYSDSEDSTHSHGIARQDLFPRRELIEGGDRNSRRSPMPYRGAEIPATSSPRLPTMRHDATTDHDDAMLAHRRTVAQDNGMLPAMPYSPNHDGARAGLRPLDDGTQSHVDAMLRGKDYAVPRDSMPYGSAHDEARNGRSPMLNHDRSIVRLGQDTDVVRHVTDQALAFAISTPGNPDGQFYDIHTHAPGYEDWKTRHVTLDDAIKAGRIAAAWADQRARQWGQDSALFKNRVLGEFADSSEEGMIPLSWVRASNERWKAWRDRGFRGEEGYRSIGVDVARSGDDKTVFAERQRFGVRQIRVYSKLSTTTIAEKLKQTHDGRYLHIEMDGGLGAAVFDILKNKGLPPRLLKPIVVGAQTLWRDRSKMMKFFNVRAAMWWNLRDMLDPYYDSEIMLPPVEELIKDLTTPQYIDKGDNVIVLESKDSIRSRLGRSTDFGDAVCLAFWGRSSGGGIVV